MTQPVRDASSHRLFNGFWYAVDEQGNCTGRGYLTKGEAIAAKRDLDGAAMRPCLSCCSPFQSVGRFNRLCPICTGKASTMDARMIG